MQDWLAEDLFDRSLKEYEYTPRMKKKLFEVIHSERFSNEEARETYHFLLGGIRTISFSDYLKRYIYLKAQITKPFVSVTREEYREIITESFRENHTPFSWESNTKRPAQSVNGWLSSEAVRRPTVFLLGFGLRMSEKDVEEFLIKVLNESTFDFQCPEEVTLWYCYRFGKGINCYRQLMKEYTELNREKGTPENGSDKALAGRKGTDPPELGSKEELMDYLLSLRQSGEPGQRKDTLFREFSRLVEETKEKIFQLYQSSSYEAARPLLSRKSVKPADIEHVIYSGVPLNSQRNLERMTSSALCRQFSCRRLSRQRLEKLLDRKYDPDRFDLLTLLFFIHCQQDAASPEARLDAFIMEANQMLYTCGMMPVYPAHPYEAFLVLCMLSFDPLDTFAEVWEQSYLEAR